MVNAKKGKIRSFSSPRRKCRLENNRPTGCIGLAKGVPKDAGILRRRNGMKVNSVTLKFSGEDKAPSLAECLEMLLRSLNPDDTEGK